MRSLVVGASGAIGSALAAALSARGDEVARLARCDGLFDLGDEASIAAGLAACADGGHFDLVFIATGALEIEGHGPEKSLRALTAEAMAAQFRVNAIGPALVIKHILRYLPRHAPARVGVLSARVGSIGDNRSGGWHAYRAAKAALNQYVHGAAIELGRTHPYAVLAALHPGTVQSALTAHYVGQHPSVAPEVAAGRLLGVLEGLSLAQSGGFYDWRGDVVPW